MRKLSTNAIKVGVAITTMSAGTAFADSYGTSSSLTGAGSSTVLFIIVGLAVIVAGIFAYKYSKKKK